MQDLLILAIKTRHLVTFVYDGLERTVEPHAVGLTGKGKLVCRGYQPDGETNTQFGWKLFSADKMIGLSLTSSAFVQPREGYKPGDKAMAAILEELPGDPLRS